MGIVYKVTNKVNNKVYIGKTVFTLDYRKNQHEKAALRGCEIYFHKAIRKHGLDAFVWETLYESPDDSTLCDYETKFIQEHNSFGILGYNLTFGGEGSDGRIVSDDTKKKLSLQKIGNKNRLGKYHSEQTRLKISNNRKMKFSNGILKGTRRRLTDTQVKSIRYHLSTEAYSTTCIAKAYNVSRCVITSIKSGKSYKNNNTCTIEIHNLRE